MLDTFGHYRSALRERISADKKKVSFKLRRIRWLAHLKGWADYDKIKKLDAEYELLVYYARVLDRGSLQELRPVLEYLITRFEPSPWQRRLHKIPFLSRFAPNVEMFSAAVRLREMCRSS